LGQRAGSFFRGGDTRIPGGFSEGFRKNFPTLVQSGGKTGPKSGFRGGRNGSRGHLRFSSKKKRARRGQTGSRQWLQKKSRAPKANLWGVDSSAVETKRAQPIKKNPGSPGTRFPSACGKKIGWDITHTRNGTSFSLSFQKKKRLPAWEQCVGVGTWGGPTRGNCSSGSSIGIQKGPSCRAPGGPLCLTPFQKLLKRKKRGEPGRAKGGGGDAPQRGGLIGNGPVGAVLQLAPGGLVLCFQRDHTATEGGDYFFPKLVFFREWGGGRVFWGGRNPVGHSPRRNGPLFSARSQSSEIGGRDVGRRTKKNMGGHRKVEWFAPRWRGFFLPRFSLRDEEVVTPRRFTTRAWNTVVVPPPGS